MMDGNKYGGWYIADSNECSGWYMVIIINIVDDLDNDHFDLLCRRNLLAICSTTTHQYLISLTLFWIFTLLGLTILDRLWFHQQKDNQHINLIAKILHTKILVEEKDNSILNFLFSKMRKQ